MDKEKTFEWTDALVREYGDWYRKIQSTPPSTLWGEDLFEYFKKEKLKEEQKLTVVSFTEDNNFIRFYLNKGYVEAISKERLADILIKESNKNWVRESKPMSEEDVIAPKQKAIINGCLISPFEDSVNKKIYSQKEYLQFGEEVFNAARKNNTEWYYKYKNFSDYMNSKGEEK